jgi:hypothetical protein
VRFCQKECGEEDCDNNFLILTLGGTEDVEIGRYQFRCNENLEILGMKRQLFEAINFYGPKKLKICERR